MKPKMMDRVFEMVAYLQTSGIDKVIPCDYAGYVTTYSDSRIIINGGTSFGEHISEKVIIQMLSTHAADLEALENGTIINEKVDDVLYSMLVTTIRRQADFSVYCIIVKKGWAYGERDIQTAILLTSITNERLSLNSRILKEKNYMENLYESIPTQITTLDTEGKVVSMNKAAEAVVGDRLMHIGKTVRSFLTEEQAEAFSPFYYEAMATRKPIERIVKFHSIDGRSITNEMVIAPLISMKDEVTGAVFYGTDVTDRKVSEKELEQLRQYALLGEISAYVAHDIKNPLAGIRSIVRLLQRDCEEDDDAELLGDIVEAVDRINKTVEELLSYARLSTYDKANISNIHQVLDNCVDAISFYHKFKEIQIHKDYDPSLPAINVKQIRIEQAFMNILLNSVQAIDKTGDITITTKYLPHENAFTVCFIDTGIGFPPSEKEHVEDPFYTTKKDGTGLGLSIVSKVVEEHSGKMEIESTPGAGTTVKITLFF